MTDWEFQRRRLATAAIYVSGAITYSATKAGYAASIRSGSLKQMADYLAERAVAGERCIGRHGWRLHDRLHKFQAAKQGPRDTRLLVDCESQQTHQRPDDYRQARQGLEIADVT